MHHPEEFRDDEALALALAAAVRGEAPPSLRTAKLKLTARCNLRCRMCSYWKGREPDRIDTRRALRLVDELAERGCRKLHVSGGELLTRPDAEEILTAATAAGLRVNVTTNGTLLTKERARALARSGIRSAAVSVDAADPSLHDYMRGVKGAWKLTMAGLQRLHGARERWNDRMRLRINTVVTRHTWEDLLRLPDLLAPLKPDQLLLIPVDEKNDRRLGLSRRQIREFNARIAPELAARGLDEGFFADSSEAYPFGRDRDGTALAAEGSYARGWYDDHLCWVPWLHTFVSADGRVYLCCMTRNRIEPLGDVTLASLATILGGPAYEAMRRRMRRERLVTCRRCDNFARENRLISEAPVLRDLEDELRASGRPRSAPPSRP